MICDNYVRNEKGNVSLIDGFAFPFAVSKSKRDIDKLISDVDRTKKDYNALNEAKNKAEV